MTVIVTVTITVIQSRDESIFLQYNKIKKRGKQISLLKLYILVCFITKNVSIIFKKENTEKLLTEIRSFVSTISSSFLSLLCSINLLLAGLYHIRSKVDLEDALSCTILQNSAPSNCKCEKYSPILTKYHLLGLHHIAPTFFVYFSHPSVIPSLVPSKP